MPRIRALVQHHGAPSGKRQMPGCGLSAMRLSIQALNATLSATWPRLKTMHPRTRATGIMNAGKAYSTAMRLIIWPRPSVRYASMKKSAQERWLLCSASGTPVCMWICIVAAPWLARWGGGQAGTKLAHQVQAGASAVNSIRTILPKAYTKHVHQEMTPANSR